MEVHMEQIKIYRCPHCGNIVVHLYNSGVPLVCCGEEMELLEPNVETASVEKHVPVIEVVEDKVCVTVGSTAHPMTREHYIEWILLQSKTGFQVHHFAPGQMPAFAFRIEKSVTPIAAYAYCNIHGLWVANV